MPRPAKSSKSVQAKIRELQKLARATAKLSAEVFGDIVSRRRHPAPPKPKSGGVALMAITTASDPVPPHPKLVALAELAHGALTIEEALPGLDPEE